MLFYFILNNIQTFASAEDLGIKLSRKRILKDEDKDLKRQKVSEDNLYTPNINIKSNTEEDFSQSQIQAQQVGFPYIYN